MLCDRCNTPLIEIDHYGRLIGCVECKPLASRLHPQISWGGVGFGLAPNSSEAQKESWSTALL